MTVVGPPGATGKNGLNGTDGQNGRDGKDGRDGRDGIKVTQNECGESYFFVIPPNSNTFSDWRRTCHVLWVKTH